MNPARLGQRLSEELCVRPGSRFRLDCADPSAMLYVDNKRDAKTALKVCHERLNELQEVLYAQGKHAVLIVLQAMDTGGKDGTIRKVFGPLNPQGVRVSSFKAPTHEERSHDYLWRHHLRVPPAGMIGIHNRSHYESVLVERVRKLAPAKRIRARYGEINEFEHYLADNGVTILKFFLHISMDEQRERLQRRLDLPEKHWKFNSSDLTERRLWDDYTAAYQKVLRACSTDWAPWHVIPANRKWFRDYAVAHIVLHALEGLKLRYPPPEPGLSEIVIED